MAIDTKRKKRIYFIEDMRVDAVICPKCMQTLRIYASNLCWHNLRRVQPEGSRVAREKEGGAGKATRVARAATVARATRATRVARGWGARGQQAIGAIDATSHICNHACDIILCAFKHFRKT